MKRLVMLVVLFALAASAATEQPYTLVLITPGKQFKAQLWKYETMRECTNDGARILTDQDIYIGFGCIIEEDL